VVPGIPPGLNYRLGRWSWVTVNPWGRVVYSKADIEPYLISGERLIVMISELVMPPGRLSQEKIDGHFT
jgi:hypothetical protein